MKDMAHLAASLVLILALALQFHGSCSSPACLENPPHLNKTYGNGTVLEIGGLKTYVSGNPHATRKAIILITDFFGYEAPNLRKLADKVAAAGFWVLAPDFLYGDPADPNNPQFNLTTWLKIHSFEKGYEDAKVVVAALKSKGVSSIGVAGFCWGGPVLVKLASSTDINAAVVLHPATLTVPDINAVKVPISLLGAQFDESSPPSQLLEFGKILSAKHEFDSFVKIFAGVSHGWSLRYDAKNESAVRSAEESHHDMINWFTKFVKGDIYMQETGFFKDYACN